MVFLYGAQNHTQVRDIYNEAGIKASTPEKRVCRQRLTRDTIWPSACLIEKKQGGLCYEYQSCHIKLVASPFQCRYVPASDRSISYVFSVSVCVLKISIKKRSASNCNH